MFASGNIARGVIVQERQERMAPAARDLRASVAPTILESFGADFMSLIRHEQTQGADARTAYAAEFAAFQLGPIERKLGRLIELLEPQARPTEAPISAHLVQLSPTSA